MAAPEDVVMVGSCKVVLIGTIPGYVPDGDRVRAAIETHQPEAIALGIPPEDLESLAALVADPSLADDLETDGMDDFMLEVLGNWGETQAIPSPDLAVAQQSGLDLVGVDLDDAAHTEHFTKLVKTRHLVQRGSARKKILATTADSAPSAHDMVLLWDRLQGAVKPLAQLELVREEHMASEIRAMTAGHSCLVAVVHAARLAGVAQGLNGGNSSFS